MYEFLDCERGAQYLEEPPPLAHTQEKSYKLHPERFQLDLNMGWVLTTALTPKLMIFSTKLKHGSTFLKVVISLLEWKCLESAALWEQFFLT